MVMEMQHTYEEQQSLMDSMIRQVALLAEIIKEVKENRARSEVNGNAEMEGDVRKAEEKEPAEAEKESEALLEGAGTTEVEPEEQEVQTKEKSITTPPDDDVSKEILEEACDESHEDEEAIERGEEIDNTPFYLQPSKVHAPEERVKEFTTVVNKEGTPTEEPPPVNDESEGCGYEEEEPEWKEEERWRRKAARSIYWVQLQPWPEPQGTGKPPYSGVRPKENKKVQGTYRHHRKRRDAMLTAVPQETPWIAERRVELEFPINDHSQESLLMPKLIRLEKNLDRPDPVNRARGNGNQRLQNFREYLVSQLSICLSA